MPLQTTGKQARHLHNSPRESAMLCKNKVHRISCKLRIPEWEGTHKNIPSGVTKCPTNKLFGVHRLLSLLNSFHAIISSFIIGLTMFLERRYKKLLLEDVQTYSFVPSLVSRRHTAQICSIDIFDFVACKGMYFESSYKCQKVSYAHIHAYVYIYR